MNRVSFFSFHDLTHSECIWHYLSIGPRWHAWWSSTKQEKQKVPLGCFLTNSINTALLDLSLAVPRVQGPMSRHRVADILPLMKIVLRASRPGLLIGIHCILCNGPCTAQRFHTIENGHTCRIWCADESDSLTHYSECPSLYNIFDFFLETCYDIATEIIFCTTYHPCVHAKSSIWYRGSGLHRCLSLPFINTALTPRTLEALMIACKEGFAWWRPSLLPTPTCIRQRVLRNTSLASSPHLPTSQAQVQVSISLQRSFHNTWKRQRLLWVGYFYKWWYSRCWWWNSCWVWCDFPISSWKNCCHVWSRRHHEAQLAFSGARTPTTLLKWLPWLKHCLFLVHMVQWPVMSSRVFYCDSMHAAGICLGTIQARTNVQWALACQQSLIHTQRTLQLTMQQVYGHGVNLGNECADHAAALGRFALTSSARCCVGHHCPWSSFRS